MEDKRTLLKQIGWSDELIDKCLSSEIILDKKISLVKYHIPTSFEKDTTNLTVNINTPTMSDGTHLI